MRSYRPFRAGVPFRPAASLSAESYGTNLTDEYRQLGICVGRILEGRKTNRLAGGARKSS
jgi:hypothetical protein